MKIGVSIAALVGVVALTQLGMGFAGVSEGGRPASAARWAEPGPREWLPEGSAWTGTRSNKDSEYAVDGRVISRSGNTAVLRTREKDNDNLTLEWTFEVKDSTLKLIKVVTTSKQDGQRESSWGSGEVRETRDGRKTGSKVDVDYGWRLKEGKGQGKGKAVEGTLKLRRD